MLDKRFVRKFTLADCQEYRKSAEAELVLTGKRLEGLKNTQTKNPGWAAYDKYADAIVGIDIRIEEQHAALEMLGEDFRLLTEREDMIKREAVAVHKATWPRPPAKQLSFFDAIQWQSM